MKIGFFQILVLLGFLFLFYGDLPKTLRFLKISFRKLLKESKKP